MNTTPFVSLNGIAKRWDGALGVEDINLDIPRGTFVALLGPSGCGKSTTLRLLAGLEVPDEGQITIAGVDVTGSAASDRNLSMVFQSYALFPHLSVAENVMFGMKVRRVPKAERTEKLNRALEITGLGDYASRKPAALSGGQRQSVAIARAVYFNAKILIMDEPTAALGVHETAMVAELIHELKKQGLGIFLISHDTREMMELCDRVAVMKNGQMVGAERVEDVTEDDILSMIILGKNPRAAA